MFVTNSNDVSLSLSWFLWHHQIIIVALLVALLAALLRPTTLTTSAAAAAASSFLHFLWFSYCNIIWCFIVTIMIRMVFSDNTRCATTLSDNSNNFSNSGIIISWFCCYWWAFIESFVVVAKINISNLPTIERSRSTKVFLLLPVGWLCGFRSYEQFNNSRMSEWLL